MTMVLVIMEDVKTNVFILFVIAHVEDAEGVPVVVVTVIPVVLVPPIQEKKTPRLVPRCNDYRIFYLCRANPFFISQSEI